MCSRHRPALLCAVVLMYVPQIGAAQQFGGSPPWGLEKPVSFHGQVRAGLPWEYAIGNGLFIKLVPEEDAWEIEVGPHGGDDDFAGCVNPPFHGPNPKEIGPEDFIPHAGEPDWGIGQKRNIDFVLTADDEKLECESLDRTLKDEDSDWGSHVTGRCLFRPANVKLVNGASNQPSIETLEFDGECAIHGAWELWRLPASYVIPDDFVGWVNVYYRQKGKTELQRDGNRYVVRLAGSATVFTSSDLRQDWRGAKFVRANGRSISAEGRFGMIWGRAVGDGEMCAPFQTFFVGTHDQYSRAGANPALKNPSWDCSKVYRVEWWR